jgi:DNA invertase Pin-like site-specific DNA recombinase
VLRVYARISLGKVGEAAGVGRQIDACRHLAEVEGWSVDEVLVDNDLSANSGACRPEYERLLDLVRRREIDVIVAYHPDRLYRRLADLVELTKVVASAGVEIRTVAAGPRRPEHSQRAVHRAGARGGGRARVGSHR